MSCPGCKSANAATKYRLSRHQIATCGDCGLEFNVNFEGGGRDGELFSETYYRTSHEEAFSAQFGDYRADPSYPVYRRWLKRIEDLKGVGRLLDVGSGLGTFLQLAKDRGWQAQGVEISAFAADYSRDRHGLDVFEGDLEKFPALDKAFDLITFWDSIEHVTRPADNLMTARRLLSDDGILLFTTDNFDCLVANVAMAAYRLSGGRVRYPMERVFIDRNQSFFTEKTFRELLKRAELEVLEFEKMEYPLDKIKTSWLERWALKGLYAAARLLQRQAQFTVLAAKK